MNRRSLFPLVPALTAAALTGCIEQDQKFVLNPDGSGKFVVKMTVDGTQAAALGGSVAGKDMGKSHALELLRGTKGVEAWSDVSHETGADGKTRLTATAYFPDLNKLQMTAGEQAGGAQTSTLTYAMKDGDWVIEMGVPGGETSGTAGAASTKTPAEIKASVQQARQQWQASKALIGPLFQSAKVKLNVTVGGTIKDTVGFAKEGESSGVLAFGGGKVLESLDKVMNDPKLEEDAVKAGDATGVLRDPKRLQRVIMESMTGGKGMPKLVATPGAPAFDYKAEVAKANATQSEALKALLEEASKPKDAVVRPPGPAPEPKKIVPPKAPAIK